MRMIIQEWSSGQIFKNSRNCRFRMRVALRVWGTVVMENGKEAARSGDSARLLY